MSKTHKHQAEQARKNLLARFPHLGLAGAPVLAPELLDRGWIKTTDERSGWTTYTRGACRISESPRGLVCAACNAPLDAEHRITCSRSYGGVSKNECIDCGAGVVRLTAPNITTEHKSVRAAMRAATTRQGRGW